MKRCVSTALWFFAAALIHGSEASAYPVVSSVPDTTVIAPGDTLTVRFMVDLASGVDLLGEYTFDVTWDASVLEFTGVAGGTTTGFTNIISNATASSSGKVSVTYLDTNGAGGIAHVASVLFKAKQTSTFTGLDVLVRNMSAAATFKDLSASCAGVTERHFTLAVSGAAEPGRDTTVKPVRFVTAHAYPNPFNPRTVIRYELSSPGNVSIALFNAVGQKVRDYRLGVKECGVHELVFDAAGLTSGLYVYRIDTGYASVTEKMLYMK